MTKKKLIRPKKGSFIAGLFAATLVVVPLAIAVPLAFSQDGPPPGQQAPDMPEGMDEEGLDGPRPEMRERMRERRMQAGRNQRGGRDNWRGMGKERRAEGRKPRGHTRKGGLQAKAKFLDFSHKYIESIQDPYQALGFAAVGIKEFYRHEGKPEQAVTELEQILATTKDRKARNILLFTIRQVYESKRDKDAFMKINKRIIEENLAAVQ